MEMKKCSRRGCENPAREGKTCCSECSEYYKKRYQRLRNSPQIKNNIARSKKKRNDRIENGLCYKCGQPSLEYTKICKVCSFKTVATSVGNSSRWKELEQLLESQNYICPYTGMKLEIGKNASIDHIVPKSKGGTDSIDNLQWVDLATNMAKRDLDESEFLQLVYRIADYQTTFSPTPVEFVPEYIGQT